MYGTSSNTFTVSQPSTNGNCWTIVVSISAAVSKVVSTAHESQRSGAAMTQRAPSPLSRRPRSSISDPLTRTAPMWTALISQ